MSETKRGRPRMVPGEVQTPVTIKLSPRLQQIAREIGDGNMTQGIRKSLERAHDRER